MAINETLTQSVKRWLTENGLTWEQGAPILGLTRGTLAARFSNARKWSTKDMDRLVELGVISPIQPAEAVVGESGV